MRVSALFTILTVCVISDLAVTDTSRASGNFVEIRLPKTVSFEIPKNWQVLSGNQRITLDSAVESNLDLTGLGGEKSSFPFAANLYDDNGVTIGMVNVRYYRDLTLTQADIRNLTSADVADYDKELQRQMQATQEVTDHAITSWYGSRYEEINGIATLVSDYHRKAQSGNGTFRVRLIRVYSGEQSCTLTVSYRESTAVLMKPITDKIIRSFRLGSLSGALVPTIQ